MPPPKVPPPLTDDARPRFFEFYALLEEQVWRVSGGEGVSRGSCYSTEPSIHDYALY